MPDMARKLSNEWKFTARTARELYDAASRAVVEHGAIKFRGRKIGMESLVNAAILYLLDVPPAEREKVLAEYVGRFERIMGDEPGPGPPPGTGARPLGSTIIEGPGRSGRVPDGDEERAEATDRP